MLQVIKPTSTNQNTENKISVFLAGSIEMGSAEDWQTEMEKVFEEFTVTFYNPRREEWDSSWEQRETNPQFNFQVNWEMNRLAAADYIFMYFAPDTKSPISLLELGLHAADGKMIVCCPDAFWRKGNVEILCSRYNIPLFNNFVEAVASLSSKLQSHE